MADAIVCNDSYYGLIDFFSNWQLKDQRLLFFIILNNIIQTPLRIILLNTMVYYCCLIQYNHQ